MLLVGVTMGDRSITERIRKALKELAQIQIVAEEFFVNISSYAYPAETGQVTIFLQPLVQENALEITR